MTQRYIPIITAHVVLEYILCTNYWIVIVVRFYDIAILIIVPVKFIFSTPTHMFFCIFGTEIYVYTTAT